MAVGRRKVVNPEPEKSEVNAVAASPANFSQSSSHSVRDAEGRKISATIPAKGKGVEGREGVAAHTTERVCIPFPHPPTQSDQVEAYKAGQTANPPHRAVKSVGKSSSVGGRGRPEGGGKAVTSL